MRHIVIVLLLTAAIHPFFGQDQVKDQKPETQDVFAPFVSRLKAVASETSILITWRDSDDLKGANLIYRHTEEINAGNIDKADLITRIPTGIQSYVDYPPDTNTYFYALIIDQYRLFIPFRNITLTGRQIKNVGALEEISSKINGIKTEVADDTIIISFSTNQPSRELLLYRSSSPLQEYTDLIGAVAYVLDPGSTSHHDNPPAGLDYYYAVLDAEMVKMGKVDLAAGENATFTPAQIPLKEETAIESAPQIYRGLPLPFLTISREVFSGKNLGSDFKLPDQQKLSTAVEEAVTKILRGIVTAQPKQMNITVLEIDQAEPQGGEEYILKAIIDESLANSQYKSAESRLKNFLSIHRSDEIEARAHYYLAQTYYFQQRYQEALMSFLMAQDFYYAKVEPWIDACFEQLTIDLGFR